MNSSDGAEEKKDLQNGNKTRNLKWKLSINTKTENQGRKRQNMDF
jgi:hypothetical protein